MPRTARERSKTGVYHVMVRGINRQDIFRDDEDRIKFLESLQKAKVRSKCAIYAYCLMDNHVHLIIAEGEEDVGHTMKRLGSSYVLWYNQKYTRVGHLFQDRFRSEVIDTEAYLVSAVRYVHQNPVKAGMVPECGRYEWSSYHAYVDGSEQLPRLTSVSLVLNTVGDTKRFVELHLDMGGEDKFLDMHTPERTSDAVAAQLIKSALAGVAPAELLKLDKSERDEILGRLKKLPGITQRQLARLTGLDRNLIQRA